MPVWYYWCLFYILMVGDGSTATACLAEQNHRHSHRRCKPSHRHVPTHTDAKYGWHWAGKRPGWWWSDCMRAYCCPLQRVVAIPDACCSRLWYRLAKCVKYVPMKTWVFAVQCLFGFSFSRMSLWVTTIALNATATNQPTYQLIIAFSLNFVAVNVF